MTPRKEKALQALLVSRTRAEAAKAAGIGESTLREYMKDPEFLDRYREAFGNLVQDAARQAGQMPGASRILPQKGHLGGNKRSRNWDNNFMSVSSSWDMASAHP